MLVQPTILFSLKPQAGLAEAGGYTAGQHTNKETKATISVT